jgi:hypothetical protein
MDAIDQRIFNWFVDTAHKLMNRGYIRAWFSWLEWILITGLITAAARKANSFTLYALAAICALMLFFVGLAGVEKLRDDLVPSYKGHPLLLIGIVLLVSVAGMWVVFNVLFTLLPASAA